MSMWDKGIALPHKIEDYVEARDKARVLLKSSYDAWKMAEDECNKFVQYGIPGGSAPREGYDYVCREIDKRFWRTAFDKAGLMQFMDQKAKQEFDRDLEKDPPPFDLDNIRSVLISAASDADLMFRRGLVNVFLGLSADYYRNREEVFKVGPKLVMGYMFESNWSGGARVGYHNAEKLNDLDRVFKTLDRKVHQPRALQMALDAHFKEGRGPGYPMYEDDYYKVRAYKNGNMHIEFKRQDLLDEANKLIAAHYADGALAERKRAA